MTDESKNGCIDPTVTECSVAVLIAQIQLV